MSEPVPTSVVMKFGGSSLADTELMRAAADRVASMRARGARVSVVVSAMGSTTDDLLDAARRVNARAGTRELDQLLATGELASAALMALTLEDAGVPAVSLSGAQCGVRTNQAHGAAHVESVHPGRVIDELSRGRVPVVAGFQGACGVVDARGRARLSGAGWAGGRGGPLALGGAAAGDVTTLGRGGSDTTAVWLAATIDAQECWICTDVDGVYDADPRLIPEARKREALSYDELLEAARLGSRVVHPDAAEAAELFGVSVVVRHAHRDANGTRIAPGQASEAPGEPTSIVLSPPTGGDAHARDAEGDGSSQAVSVSGSGGPRRLSLVGQELASPMRLLRSMRERLCAHGFQPADGQVRTHSVGWLVQASEARAATRAMHEEFVKHDPIAAPTVGDRE